MSVLLTMLLALGGCSNAPSEVAVSNGPSEEAAPVQPEARPLPDDTLLFVSERNGSPEVWSQRLGGGEAKLVASSEGGVFPGAPDPLGTHALVITAEEGEQGHQEALWLVPLDGGERTRLTPDFSRVRNPAWSPDGRWIAFESDENSYGDVYRVPREGGDRVRLTAADHGSFEPSISPDGAHLLVGSSRDGNAEIYLLGINGEDPRRLTDQPADDTSPSWSPDGKQIAWISDVQGMPRVWLMRADGSQPRPLRPVPDSPALDLTFAWSPDSARLAVAVQTGARQVELRVVDAATGRELAVLGGDGVTEHPAWSPDSQWIAFSSNRDGDTEVYVASADGTQVHRITHSPGPDWLPRWGPTAR